MADNTVQNGTDTMSSDDITSQNGAVVSGFKAQRVKVQYGDDSIARDVSSNFPLPVITAGTRVPVVLHAAAVTSATAEALITLAIYRGGTVTSGTTYTVTTGKTFRITAIQFGARFITPSATATFASARFNLRAAASGAATVTSPLVYGDTKMSSSATPTPNSDLSIPEGLDFTAGMGIAVTHIDSAATLALDVLIVGYEY